MTLNPQTRRLGLEALAMLLAGVLWMLACEYLLAGRLLVGGETTGSDVGEHFWMLHALGNPGWANFSHNRYPLPSVIARLSCVADHPFPCWRQASLVAAAALGSTMYLWGRVVGGRVAGAATVLLAATFPELVLSERTVSAYPQILAIWTGAAAVAGIALRAPGVGTVLLAGIGVGAVFASDARGLLVGIPLLVVVGVAAIRAGWRSWPGVVLPIWLSWWMAGAQPVVPRSLEGLIETTIEMSFVRAGEGPPVRPEREKQGYIWGRSDLRKLPSTFRFLAEATTRMSPDTTRLQSQLVARATRIDPLVTPIALLLLGVPLALRRRPLQALALLPAAPMLALLYNAWKFEYYDRYAALGMTACAVLGGLGLSGWASLTRRRWLAIPAVILLLTLLPTALSLRAAWRTPFGAQQDLQRCIAGQINPNIPVDECVRAAQSPFLGVVTWPF